MNFSKVARIAWLWVRWPIFIAALLFIGLVIYRAFALEDEKKTAGIVAEIQAQRLTEDDVDGTNLPPQPDPALAAATVEGIDANANGIRDDVELVIFAKYPSDKKVRAAELQYAMALQTYLTKVINSETWKAVAEQSSRGFACISDTFPRDNLETYFKITDARTDEVKDLVFNTPDRKDGYNKVDKFTTSFGLPSQDVCDLGI